MKNEKCGWAALEYNTVTDKYSQTDVILVGPYDDATMDKAKRIWYNENWERDHLRLVSMRYVHAEDGEM